MFQDIQYVYFVDFLWNFHFLQEEEINFQKQIMQLETKEFFMETKMEVYLKLSFLSQETRF